jgi:hypothetical protein
MVRASPRTSSCNAASFIPNRFVEEYDVNLDVKYEGDRFAFWGFVEEVDTLPATFSKGKKKGNK